MTTPRVGFIGLGNLGMLLAKALTRNGISLLVYDHRPEAVAVMEAVGARAAGSSRALAAASDMVISVVRDAAQTDEVMLGPDGVFEGAKAGSIVVISSTVGPGYCRTLAKRARSRGVHVVDAAVSTESRSFVPGAERADFTLMVGGSEDAVAACLPVFNAMARNVFHVGDVGAGQACKLVNNLAMFANGIVARECLHLGMKAGLDPEQLIQVMRVSTGDSRSLAMVARLLAAATPASKPPAATGAGVQDLGTKDRELAFELAEDVHAATPVARFMADLDMTSAYETLPLRLRRPDE